MDFNPVPFDFAGSFSQWLIIVGILIGGSLGLSLLLAVARNGASGVPMFTRGLTSYLSDLGSLSLRRILAITSLTFKEAVRRKALLIFVVFAVLLMFAGWFLSNSNSRAELQANVHITFVLRTIAWLILPAVIFLSCWGIPEDIRLRSMHTVVTKPARRMEIVLGRMLGFGTVTILVLCVMGVIGYVWIQRQIPENVRNNLTCRVPVFGHLLFIDTAGQPSYTGINVGDTWMYRSYVQGNSRARAVWMFSNVTPDALVGDVLRLESRFEAFRTVKGSEKSIREGIEGQFTLVKNARDEAFGGFALGASTREMADLLREGQFRNAADKLKEFAEKIRTKPKDIPDPDYAGLAGGAQQASGALKVLNSDTHNFDELSQLFKDLFDTTFQLSDRKAAAAAGNTIFEDIAAKCDAVADYLKTNADDLLDHMPRLEVPLPTFTVTEFHEGDDIREVNRKLEFVADYETLGRFLAKTISRLNDAGKVVEGDSISPAFLDTLAEEKEISPLNAELLLTVLTEQLQSGALRVADGKLAVADGRRWFPFFDDLVRRELLVSQDSEGWLLTLDLFEDLTTAGFLRIEVSCLNDQMYLGMARPDLFIRLPDRPFYVGYTKAILTTGLMLLLVVVIGVTSSCVVKGPVSVFLTLTMFIVGQFFHDFMLRIVSGNEQGLGLIESAALIWQHRNPSVGLDASEATQKFVQGIDSVSTGFLAGVSRIIPDFSVFGSAAAHVEKGFDVPLDASVWPSVAAFFAFMIPCVLLAGACLKFRELESK